MTEEINVNDILDDLAYSISSAESEHLNQLIREGNYKEATKILSDYCSEEEIKLLFEHFKKESERKYSLEEVHLEELIESVRKSYEKKEYINPSLLINYKGNMGVSSICVSNDLNKIEVYLNGFGFVPLSEVQQVWLLKKN